MKKTMDKETMPQTPIQEDEKFEVLEEESTGC